MVYCYIIDMDNRNKKGQFIKGTHWRKPKPYWNKEWLVNEYHVLGKTASKIAHEQGCNENNILYFIRKHQIKTRTMSEIRAKKHWGLYGEQNGMYGRTGKDNPNWDGGHSPERQSEYAKSAWKQLAKSILMRDNYRCRDCGHNNNLQIHHVKKWSRYPELRFDPNNLQTLCKACHKKKHSRKN